MNNYSPSSEPDSERVLLLQIEPDQYGTGNQRIIATVVRRASPDIKNPDTGSIQYRDGSGRDANIGYRNCTWSSGKNTALFVEDMQIYAQFETADQSAPYGGEIVFRPHRVAERDALGMANTFTKLNKALQKLEDKFGYTKNFGDTLIRVASVLGITTFATYKNGPGGSLAQEFREFGATSVHRNVDLLVEQARPAKA